MGLGAGRVVEREPLRGFWARKRRRDLGDRWLCVRAASPWSGPELEQNARSLGWLCGIGKERAVATIHGAVSSGDHVFHFLSFPLRRV